MTAVPAGGSVALRLICDGCGRTGPPAEPRVPHHEAWLLLWGSACQDGWRGHDRAIGPHYCAHCAD
ncbi:hypothetical protein GCM10027199_64960 [Amycolatopsis magusensis]